MILYSQTLGDRNDNGYASALLGGISIIMEVAENSRSIHLGVISVVLPLLHQTGFKDYFDIRMRHRQRSDYRVFCSFLLC